VKLIILIFYNIDDDVVDDIEKMSLIVRYVMYWVDGGVDKLHIKKIVTDDFWTVLGWMLV
jgi:hypothetical protein